jgi:hypothetical protein
MKELKALWKRADQLSAKIKKDEEKINKRK